MRPKTTKQRRKQHEPELLESRELLSVSPGAFIPGPAEPAILERFDRSEISTGVHRIDPIESRTFASVSALPIDGIQPGGSLAFEQEISGEIENVGDVESVTLDLTPDHTIALTMDSSASLLADVIIKDPLGTQLAHVTAASSGDSIFVQSIIAPITGTYTFEFRGAGATTGTFSSTVYLNSAIERERFTGVSNDSSGTAQDIDAVFVSLPVAGSERAFIVANATPANETEDWYSFSLDDGDVTTIALQELSSANNTTIELFDAGSNLLANGESSFNSSQIVLDFVDTTTDASSDTYFVKVSNPSDEYGLLTTRATSFDREGNNTFSTSQEITSTDSVLGHVAEIAGSSLSLIETFAGPGFSGSIPPDPIIAVGPEQIVASVNSSIAIYDKESGQELFAQDMRGGAGSFFENVGGVAIAFDPWIVFDTDSNRFFFVAIDVESEEFASLYLAISTDSTPTNGTDWHKYKLNFAHDPEPLGLGTGNHFPDYEKISVTDDAVYISGNYFAINDGTGVYAGITAFEKQPFLSGQPANMVYQEFMGDGFSVFPLDQRGLGDVQYFAEARPSDTIRIHAVSDVLTNPMRHTHDLIVGAFDEPVNVPQLSGATPVEAISSRVMSGVWRDGSAWFAHPITDPGIGDGETVARWYEVATNDFPVSNPTLIQSESLDPGPDLHAFMPAIAVDGNGNMGIGFSLGGPNIHVGAGYSGRLASDPLGSTVFPVQQLVEGKASYDVAGSSGRNRWGDYSGMVVDPVDDKTFWAINLYANASGTWSTQLGSFQIEPGPDIDYYSFAANTGDILTIETVTPYDALSSTSNVPDLEIELYDSTESLIASDFDSAPDGRNAKLSHTVTAGGTFTVRVATTLDDGAYILKVEGATGNDSAPVIDSSIPSNLQKTNQFPQTVSFTASEAVAVPSVSPTDLLGDLTATAVAVQGSTITFTIDPASNVGDGIYTFMLNAGSVDDLQGNGLAAQYSAAFEYDSVGIQLLSTTWNGSPLPADRILAPGDLDFTTVLSEDPLLLISGRRGPLTPGTDDVSLTDLDSGIARDETFLQYDEATNTFSASYAGLPEGKYELRMRAGPGAFIDEAGNGLDGDLNPGAADGTPTGNGTPGDDYALEIFVDNGALAASAFTRLGTQSAAISTSIGNTGVLHNDTDTDTFTFYAQAGEIISVVGTVDREAITTIGIPSLSATQTAAAAGEPVYLQGIQIPTDGVYQVDVSADDTAIFEIQIFRNAILEPENSDLDGLNPMPIDGGTIQVDSSRIAIVGTTAPHFELVQSNNPSLFFDISPTGIEGVPITFGKEDLETVITTTIGNSAFPAGDVSISDNGGILFDSTNLIFQNLPLEIATSFNAIEGYALLPFWDDLVAFPEDPEETVVWAGETTVAGIPTLVVQWDQIPNFDLTRQTPPEWGTATFQVQVFETGPILARYSYKDVNFEDGTGVFDQAGNATIGYLHGDGRFVERSFNTKVLADGDIIDVRVRPDIDAYTVDLSSKVGNNVDIVIAGHVGQDLSDEILEIYDDNDVLLAAGVSGLNGGSADNYGLGILDFLVPNTGTGVFTIRVSSREEGPYEVVLTDAMKLESEPNENGDTLRTLGGGIDRMLGFLDGTDNEDRIEVAVAAGEQIRLKSVTPFFDPQSSPLVDLDPAITLYADDGTTILAADSNSLDGRNADLTFTPSASGTFVIAVTTESGTGEYVLQSEILTLGLDFGDAPAPFPTLLTDDGARHLATGPLLGVERDVEGDGQPNANADGDDLDAAPDDEDGVAALAFVGGDSGVSLDVQVTDAVDALLNVWIDFDGDGAWSAAEQIANDTVAVEGNNALPFDVPVAAVAGNAAARIRVSTQSGLDATGFAIDGEVEDYQVQLASAAAFNIDDVAVVEGDSGVVGLDFTVSRSHTLTDVSVQFSTVDGTAIAGSDYVADSGMLSFVSGGALSKTVSIDINGDIAAEIDEQFTLELSSAVGATIAQATGTGTITNDDLAAIERVVVAGDDWSTDVKQLLDPELELGFPIENGSGQLDIIPWNNVNRIYLVFTSDDIAITQANVELFGVNSPDHTNLISDVSFLANVATIELSAPLPVDKYLLRVDETVTDVNGAMIDGEWTTSVSTLSGNEIAGGDFLYRFNVLPGDGNRDGGVTGPDIALPRGARFTLVGTPGYQQLIDNDQLIDYDGNGFIAGPDISWARGSRFTFMPAGEPTVPAAAVAALEASQTAVEGDAIRDDDDEHELSQIRYLKKTLVRIESSLHAWIS